MNLQNGQSIRYNLIKVVQSVAAALQYCTFVKVMIFSFYFNCAGEVLIQLCDHFVGCG